MKNVNNTGLGAGPDPVVAVHPDLVAEHVADLGPEAASPTVGQRVGVAVKHVLVADHLCLLRSRKAGLLPQLNPHSQQSAQDLILDPGLVLGQNPDLVPDPDHLLLRVLNECCWLLHKLDFYPM